MMLLIIMTMTMHMAEEEEELNNRSNKAAQSDQGELGYGADTPRRTRQGQSPILTRCLNKAGRLASDRNKPPENARSRVGSPFQPGQALLRGPRSQLRVAGDRSRATRPVQEPLFAARVDAAAMLLARHVCYLQAAGPPTT
jgi:hypothetical protein